MEKLSIFRIMQRTTKNDVKFLFKTLEFTLRHTDQTSDVTFNMFFLQIVDPTLLIRIIILSVEED